MFDNNDPLGSFDTGIPAPDPTPNVNPLDGIDFEDDANFTPVADEGTAFIRITSTNGVTNVPVSEAHTVNGVQGYTVAEVLALGQLYTQAGSVIWVNNSEVEPSFIVQPGQSITVIGPAKGG